MAGLEKYKYLGLTLLLLHLHYRRVMEAMLGVLLRDMLGYVHYLFVDLIHGNLAILIFVFGHNFMVLCDDKCSGW